jgi:hypothetical protein
LKHDILGHDSFDIGGKFAEKDSLRPVTEFKKGEDEFTSEDCDRAGKARLTEH